MPLPLRRCQAEQPLPDAGDPLGLGKSRTSHLVTVTLSGRRDGTALQAAGSIPVSFAEWGIQGPRGLGFFGSLAGQGSAEFLLTLHRH